VEYRKGFLVTDDNYATIGGTGVLTATCPAARPSQIWVQEPLPPAQSELLRLAHRRPGITVAEAAHELRLAPNTISTLVGKLGEQGLLCRGKDTAYGRAALLTVTDKAARRIAEWRDLRAELAAKALERLSADDQQAIAAVVPALLRLAQPQRSRQDDHHPDAGHAAQAGRGSVRVFGAGHRSLRRQAQSRRFGASPRRYGPTYTAVISGSASRPRGLAHPPPSSGTPL
jgi:DNA-binding MarR family transcriptional regulator